MKIINGIAYAKESVSQLEVVAVKPLDDWMMIVAFNNGEERLFDATSLLHMPAFQPLQQDEIFKKCQVEDGIVTWMDGDIDIAPETMYRQSYRYEHNFGA